MNNITRSISSVGGAFSLIMALIVGFALPANAVDYAAPPQINNLQKLSPSVVFSGERFIMEWDASTNTTHGDLVFADPLGGQKAVHYSGSSGTFGGVSIDDKWVPGAYEPKYVTAHTDYGYAVYYPSGSTSTYPSGIRQPEPATFDWASLEFQVGELQDFANAAELTVSGTMKVGETITANLPPLEPAPTNVEYRWIHADGYFDMTTSEPTFVLRPEDAGKRMTVRAYATKHGYRTYLGLYEAQESVIGPIVSSAPVTISGTATVGQTLTAILGTLNPTPEKVSYTWKRNGEAIAEASARQLQLTQADAGTEISVTVTAQRAGYEPLVETSAPTARILNFFSYAGQPTISGNMQVGQILRVEKGPWSPVPDSMSYIWLRNGAVIAESSEPTYHLSAEDAGSTLTVRVTAVKAGYETTSMSSPPTPHIAAAPAPISFLDVTSSTQFYTEISWLAAQGISTGWIEAGGSRTYRPLSPVARDAMAAFLYRLAGNPDFTPPAVSPFADVSSSTQFYKEITWLAARNISTGWLEPDGRRTFRPLEPVNRDAMAAFLYRFDNYPSFQAPTTSPFVDVSTDNIFYHQISWLASKGISTGFPIGSGCYAFDPVRPVNRDAMAAFMYRFVNGGTPPTSGGGCTANQQPG
ncbi:MAG: putative S-layer domain protein [Pseudarthrobacter sp.]|nr:putative S-layer domain protein [Pseudarthrobacter sp.]